MELVTIIRPYDAKQVVYVFDDGGNECEGRSVNLENIISEFELLSKEYDVNRITLKGSNVYCLKIKENIDNNNITKYDKKIEVIIAD